jgi:hypothetical protein
VDLPLYLCGTTYAISVLLVYLFFYSYRAKRTTPPQGGSKPSAREGA